jgi:ribosomal protein S18 acetylase RimI-like enzyme
MAGLQVLVVRNERGVTLTFSYATPGNSCDDHGVLVVRPLRDDDLGWTLDALVRAWNSRIVARKGELIDAGALDGFVAVCRDGRCGLLTYAARDDGVEIVTLQVDTEGVGVGRALLDAARDHAVQLCAGRMWLVTSNDNYRAFRFYQRWGMDLVAFYRDGMVRSRQLKPVIPLVDSDGVPISHELEFELVLRSQP